jgi:nucleoporin SEH1
LESLAGHGDIVTDVCWAPNMGRSFELIATACRDGHVRIFKLKENTDKELKKKYVVSCIGDFPDHDAPVWRVEWNVTGTVLSSSGDDGKIRLWKSSFLEEWRCITVVTADNAQSESVAIER